MKSDHCDFVENTGSADFYPLIRKLFSISDRLWFCIHHQRMMLGQTRSRLDVNRARHSELKQLVFLFLFFKFIIKPLCSLRTAEQSKLKPWVIENLCTPLS